MPWSHGPSFRRQSPCNVEQLWPQRTDKIMEPSECEVVKFLITPNPSVLPSTLQKLWHTASFVAGTTHAETNHKMEDWVNVLQCTYAPSTIYTWWYPHNVYDRSISTDLANSALLWSLLCRHFKNGKSCLLSGGERRAMDAMAFLELDVRQKLSATSFQLNQELSCITL